MMNATTSAELDPGGPPQFEQPSEQPYMAPLSFAQLRLWFLYKLEPKSSAYNLAAGIPERSAARRALQRSCTDCPTARDVANYLRRSGWKTGSDHPRNGAADLSGATCRGLPARSNNRPFRKSPPGKRADHSISFAVLCCGRGY